MLKHSSERARGRQEGEGPPPAILLHRDHLELFRPGGSESEVRGGAPESASLRSAPVKSCLLFCVPHLEKHGSIPLIGTE